MYRRVMPPTRLNHAVLYVRDAESTARFFAENLEFEVTARMPGAVFISCAGSLNDHDLGLFTVGEQAAPSTAGRQTVGLYHLAWEVPTLGELKSLADKMASVGALRGASDHATSKSLYCVDPDGLEFELFWAVPSDFVPEGQGPVVERLDLDGEIERFGAETIGRVTFVAPD